MRCGSGSWGGRCLSLGDYVTGMGPQGIRPLAEGASVAYARLRRLESGRLRSSVRAACRRRRDERNSSHIFRGKPDRYVLA